MEDICFCHLCGQKIYGSGNIFRHDEWLAGKYLRVCEDCLQKNQRCRVCGLPFTISTPNGLCVTCNASSKFCLVCGKPVGDNYYEFDQLKPYCNKCIQEKTPCDICGAPLTEESWRLSDGRLMCAYCHSLAIYSPSDATKIFAEIKEAANQQLGIQLNIPTGLALVDRNQLSEVIHSQMENCQSDSSEELELDPQQTLGLYARRGMWRGIYIQTGLPPLLFLQVAAHEFGHAWQLENCPLMRNKLSHEGFAEWVSYHVLGYYGYTSGQKRMQARQDIYGRGLAWALEIESSQGTSGVLEVCRRSV